MTAAGTIPSSFVDAWMPEFVKTVEMFTGTSVAIEPRQQDTDAAAPAEGVLWHEQTFERTETGKFWIGAPAPDAVRLLGESASDETSGAALFRELVGQSLKAAAEMLNSSSHPGLKGLDTVSTDAPPSSSTGVSFLITGSGAPIPVWLRCDEAFTSLLHSAGEAAPQPVGAPAISAPPPIVTPDSLHGIDLPVVVVLGRATLRIAEVLKLTVGSIVELDRRVGEPVEVCIQGVVVARGEVVSIRGNYGVRIVEVLRRNRLQVQAGNRPLRAPQAAVAGDSLDVQQARAQPGGDRHPLQRVDGTAGRPKVRSTRSTSAASIAFRVRRFASSISCTRRSFATSRRASAPISGRMPA